MNEERRKTQAEKLLLHYLSQHSMRSTPERMHILDKVVSFHSDFTQADLSSVLAEDGFRISQATVYNTLRLFETIGIVRKLLVDNGIDTFECVSLRPDNRIMLVCSKCGRTRDIKDAEIANNLGRRRYPSFVMSGFVLYVRGLCSKCRSGGRPKK